MKIKIISEKFNRLSDELLSKFIDQQTSEEEEHAIMNSICNETDLWLLKNILRSSETKG